eukprot:Skav236429  [mRNA]  locus=scaffold1156:80070:84344:+ [translate_table: standard]
MPQDFLAKLNDHAILVTRIQDDQWQKQVAWLHSDLWCISAPCQSWSLAGNQDGLSSSNGLCFAESISQVRIHRPKVVCLEQVKGFTEHKEFPVVERLMEWAGYDLVTAGVHDLASLAPTHRSRWLALYVRKGEALPSMRIQPWPSNPPKPRDFDFVLPMSDEQTRPFVPTAPVAGMYFDPALMPAAGGPWTHAKIVQKRIPDLESPLPCFLSQYGNQHNLPLHRLKKSGLLGHFLRQGKSFRFFAPHEVAMLHCQVGALVLLKPAQLSWTTVGNSISSLHSAYLLSPALQVLNLLPEDFDAVSLLQHMVNSRVTSHNAELFDDEFAWYLGTPDEVAQHHQLLHYFIVQMKWNSQSGDTQWIRGTFFSPTKGCLMMDHEPAPASALCVPDDDQPDPCLTPNMTQSPDQPGTDDEMDQFPADSTLPLHVWFQVHLRAIPDMYGTFKVSADTTWKGLLAVWHNQFLPQEFELSPAQFAEPISAAAPQPGFALVPQRFSASPHFEWPQGPAINMLVFRDDEIPSTDLWLYEVDPHDTWSHFNTRQTVTTKTVYDIFGCIPPNATLTKNTTVNMQALPATNPDESAPLPGSLYDVEVQAFIPPDTDILVCHFRGSPRAKDAIVEWWFTESMKLWYAFEGRQVHFLDVDDNTWRVIFRPAQDTTAVPVSAFVQALPLRLLQQAAGFGCSTPGIPWQLKVEGRVLCEQTHPLSTTMFQLSVATQFLSKLTLDQKPLTLMSGGLQCEPFHTLYDLHNLMPSTPKVVIYLVPKQPQVLRLTGGGGPIRNPTSKQDHVRYVEAGMAQLLLEHAVDLPQIAPTVTKLLDTIGLPRLHQLLHSEQGVDQRKSFAKLCQAADVVLPPHADRPALVAAKHKKHRVATHKHAHHAIPLDQYKLQTGFFKNHDGTDANLLPQFAPTLSGVAMMDPHAAQQWLEANEAITPDELAIYVVGDLRTDPSRPHIDMNVPALDSQGRPVILKGKLVQLGSKHIRTVASESKEVDTPAVQVVAVTCWKQDFAPDMWQRLISAPVKTTRDLMSLEGFADVFGRAWGRAYRCKGAPVEPHLADSIQYHSEVRQMSRLSSLLKRSGFNQIFLLPKDASGAIDTKWTVIWLSAPVAQIEMQATSIPGAAGLIRGNKSHGLRIEATQFAAAWHRLKPNQPLPDLRQCSFLFRLQPMPLGVTAEILKVWASQQGWDIKPLKSVGAKRWLVSSDSQPPTVLIFNSQPVLAQQMPSRKDKPEHDVVAGPRMQQPKKVDETLKPRQVPYRTGDPFMDPWAPQSSHPSSTIQTRHTAHEQASDSKASTPAGVEPRPLTGPISDVIGHQDARLTAMETTIAKLEQSQADHQTQTTHKFAALESTMHQQAQHTQQSLDHLHQEQQSLNGSLTQAFQRQDGRLAAAMEELKALFLATRGTKRTDPEPRDEEELEEESDT